MSKLVPCPVCGIKEGYFLHPNSENTETHNYFDVCCNNCYATVNECCLEDGEELQTTANKSWNDAGAYAESLRLKIIELEELSKTTSV